MSIDRLVLLKTKCFLIVQGNRVPKGAGINPSLHSWHIGCWERQTEELSSQTSDQGPCEAPRRGSQMRPRRPPTLRDCWQQAHGAEADSGQPKGPEHKGQCRGTALCCCMYCAEGCKGAWPGGSVSRVLEVEDQLAPRTLRASFVQGDPQNSTPGPGLYEHSSACLAGAPAGAEGAPWAPAGRTDPISHGQQERAPCRGVGHGIRTFHRQEHGLADVGANPVAGLAQVVANVLLQHVPDEQRAVGKDLDAAGERDRMVLLGVSTACKKTGGVVFTRLLPSHGGAPHGGSLCSLPEAQSVRSPHLLGTGEPREMANGIIGRPTTASGALQCAISNHRKPTCEGPPSHQAPGTLQVNRGQLAWPHHPGLAHPLLASWERQPRSHAPFACFHMTLGGG